MKLAIDKISINGRHRRDMGDVAALADSIKSVGLLHPVVVTKDHRLIAGERRIAAAGQLGWKQIEATIAENITDALALLTAERDENTCRKNFAPSEAVAVGEALEAIEKPKAEARRREGNSRGGQVGGKLPPTSKQKTRDTVAAAVGLSGKTYEAARSVVAAAKDQPEKFKAVKEQMDRTGNVNAAVRELKEHKREQRRQENREKIAATPKADIAAAGAKFATIVIDPPWDWGDEGDCDQLGRARPVYGTMPIEDIRALPVAKLADDDCHVYLWITNRSLPKGFALLEAWGFRYVTCLTWCKPSIGMGNYFRGSTEQVLFGVKGSQPLKRKDVGTWFAADRGDRHSAKPVEFSELVESCSPGPWLEMFSRSKRQGWTAWGAEAA